jgi:hypothetical protein
VAVKVGTIFSLYIGKIMQRNLTDHGWFVFTLDKDLNTGLLRPKTSVLRCDYGA